MGSNSSPAFVSPRTTANCTDSADSHLQLESQNTGGSASKLKLNTKPGPAVTSNLESESLQKPASQTRPTLSVTANVSDVKFVIAFRSFVPPKPERQLTFDRGDVIQVVQDTGKWHLGIIHRRNGVPQSVQGRRSKPKFYPPNYVKPFRPKGGAQTGASPDAITTDEKATSTSTSTSASALRPTATATAGNTLVKSLRLVDNQREPELGLGTSQTSSSVGAVNETKNSELATSAVNPNSKTIAQKNTASLSRGRAEAVYVRARAGYEAKKPSQLSFAKDDIIQVIDSKSGKWHRGKLVKSKQYPLTKSKALFYPSNFVKPITPTDSKSD